MKVNLKKKLSQNYVTLYIYYICILITGIATIAPVKRGCHFEGEKNLTLFKVQNLKKSLRMQII